MNDALKEWLVMKYREKNQKLINKIPKLTIDLKDRRKDFICGICGDVVNDSKEQEALDYAELEELAKHENIPLDFIFENYRALSQFQNRIMIMTNDFNSFIGVCYHCAFESAKIIWESEKLGE